MKISSISDVFRKNSISKKNYTKNNTQTLKNNNVDSFSRNKKAPTFKGIFLNDDVCLGKVSADKARSKFLKKDALLLREIASLYPNQDCFITAGRENLPSLAFRETPVDIQKYSYNLFGQNSLSINPDDKDYPILPLIIYPDEPEYDIRRKLISLIIGVPSFISINPSLPYTVKVGYELHKKLIEKKYQILKVLGQNEQVDIGADSIAKKAHESIEGVENAVTRYLLESAFMALSDRVSAGQLYASNYNKIQNTLQNKRDLDLVTPLSKQFFQNDKSYDVDICEEAVHRYPDDEENKEEILKLVDYMLENDLYLFSFEGVGEERDL